VTPGTGRARLAAGAPYPAEGVQFEAIAYARRSTTANGKQAVVPAALKDDPASDVVLGPVPATFALAEEKTRDGDDDLRWVSRIASNGSYVPNGNYSAQAGRTYSNEASGLVKVLATYRRGARTYKAEAQLAVTVPDFVQRIR
jgi:quinohemoprotein amine dehydrogenase